jgi:hypothetical protein
VETHQNVTLSEDSEALPKRVYCDRNFFKNKKWLLLNIINFGLMILLIRFTSTDDVVDAEKTEKC